MSAETATVAEQEYLETIFWLYEAGLPITGANVARAMQVSAPTVHEMIGRLERDGYITRAADKSVSFTDSGRSHAAAVGKRHRLIERFLTDGLGIPRGGTAAAAKSVPFTDSGGPHAAAVVRRHRLIERFLTDVLGIPWDEVHEEAERPGHAPPAPCRGAGRWGVAQPRR